MGWVRAGVLILLGLRPVDPTTWDILGRVLQKRIRSCLPTQGRVSLKNQVLPKHFFFEHCFDSLEAQGVSTLQNLAVFHSLGYFLGGCHQKIRSYLRTQWVSMDLLETIGVMPGDLGDFLRTSGYETWAGFELVF